MRYKVGTNESIKVTQDDDHVPRWNRGQAILEQVIDVVSCALASALVEKGLVGA